MQSLVGMQPTLLRDPIHVHIILVWTHVTIAMLHCMHMNSYHLTHASLGLIIFSSHKVSKCVEIYFPRKGLVHEFLIFQGILNIPKSIL